MSVSVMALVWKFSAHKGDALLVLLAMADWCDDAGTCYPSVKKLALKSRMTDRGVQKVIRRLEASGEVVIDAKGGIFGGRKLANVYRLTVAENPMGEQRAPMPARVNGEAPKGERGDTPGVNGRSPHTSVEPPDNPSGLKAADGQLFADVPIPHPEIPHGLRTPELLTAWAEWKEHRREKRQPMTALAMKKQVLELVQWEAQSPGLAIAAIDHSIKSGYTGLFLPKGKPTPGKLSQNARGPITTENALRMPEKR